MPVPPAHWPISRWRGRHRRFRRRRQKLAPDAKDEIQPREALFDTGKTALSSAIATAAATAAATSVANAASHAFTERGLLRLAVMFGVGTAVLYGLNRWSDEKSGE
ncbi:MAG: hypothetical protein HZT40_14565 [Candidatus Thiothrix singaporensis]|uniref:Uncharacterized protein n=1 Tax=Candidatus Thiothrix singaporensis TaxID=2799669 RepID=A0A7L6AU90_9GAMM|nr:MAG: hypothetical protein HZT40_14565 [Candidatus Thiothrix singaporensis]